MVLSRVQSSKNQLVTVRNGVVNGDMLIIYTCHGEKWGCHGSGLQNMVFLSRVQSSKNQLVTVRNEWVCHGCSANNIDLSL